MRMFPPFFYFCSTMAAFYPHGRHAVENKHLIINNLMVVSYMKQIKMSLALGALCGVMTLASCTSDDVVNNSAIQPGTAQGFAPAKASDISFHSAGSVLATTRATRSGDNAFKSYVRWAGDFPAKYKANIPADITDAEKKFVVDYIKNHKDEAGVAFNYSNYFMQAAGSSAQYYNRWNGYPEMGNANLTGGNEMVDLVINGQRIDGYNAYNGHNTLFLNLPFKDPTYRDKAGDVNQTKHDAYKIYKIEYNGKTAFYLGFDYKFENSKGERLNGDGIYNDWVVRMIPADGIDQENSGMTPGTPENPSTPTPPAIVTGNKGEVEVNLSLNEKKTDGDYIATKLSIHVRDTADVEVFIPVEAQYYCQADDMNIVLSHKKLAEQYNNSANDREMAWTVAGQTVKLTVSYATDGIRVKTQGVNKAVLKALREQYGDGITFEVWNYFKSEIAIPGTENTEAFTREKLQPMLDKSTVSFTEAPGRYVNAFGALYDYDDGNRKVYTKIENQGAENEVWTPFTDEECTTPLAPEFWTRPAGETKYYELKTHVNPLDCIVKPADAAFTEKGKLLYSPFYKKD